MSNYLYNGVELPALPEWDKATYPHAVILEQTTRYRLVATTKKFVCNSSGNLVDPDGATIFYVYYDLNKGDQGWSDMGNAGLLAGLSLNSPMWSNYDVYDTDGNLYLAASEPILVPEEPVTTLDPKSMLMGWLVGRRIAGMRGRA